MSATASLRDLFSLRGAPPPLAAVEVAARRVSAAAVEIRAGRPTIVAHASEALPEGALVAGLTAENVRDTQAVAGALARVLEQIGRPRRVGLVVPDPVARVSIVRFQEVPADAGDLDQLLRWQVRKSAPFPIEAAQVTYVQSDRTVEGQAFVVSVAKREVVQEYETICETVGVEAGVVDISTFNVINAVLAEGAPPAGDWLLVNVAVDYASMAILRGSDLIFFRTRGSDAEETLGDLVHQTAMYYEDRLGGSGFARVLLSGASTGGDSRPADVNQIRRMLDERVGASVHSVDPRQAAPLPDRITASPALLDTLAPLVGLLVREQPI
jgi:Type IV pilus assembly protein PilM